MAWQGEPYENWGGVLLGVVLAETLRIAAVSMSTTFFVMVCLYATIKTICRS